MVRDGGSRLLLSLAGKTPINKKRFHGKRTALVFRLGNSTVPIALKCAALVDKRDESEAMELSNNENRIYDIIELSKEPLSALIMQSFFRLPGLNFMPCMVQTLEQRVKDMQLVKDPTKSEVRVLKGRWTAEMSEATAWLEGNGLVHGNLQPCNMLLDNKDHLVLTDFGHAKSIGAYHAGNSAPCPCPDRYSTHGAATEQFALGAVFFFLHKGHRIKRERLMQDPVATKVRGEDPLTRLMWQCWKVEFSSMAELASAAAQLEGAQDTAKGPRFGAEELLEAKALCKRLLEKELADITPHPDARLCHFFGYSLEKIMMYMLIVQTLLLFCTWLEIGGPYSASAKP